MNKQLIYAILFFLLPLTLFGQAPRCLTDELYLNPDFVAKDNRYQASYESYLGQSHSQRSTYVVPVVVHVLNSPGIAPLADAIILDQIDVLNLTFQRQSADSSKTPPIFQPLVGNANVEFRLAQIDPYGCPTDGINNLETIMADHNASHDKYLKALVQWPPQQYLNIWIVERIDGGFIQGYATLPQSMASSPELDGVVLSYGIVGSMPNNPLLEGEIATHEVGHWLGLYHVFQDGCSGTTPQDCASAGDRVCDTPQSAAPSYSCASSLNSCTDIPNDLPDFEANYMSYGSDSCMTMFSQGQVTRMHFFLDSVRHQVHSPANLSATGVDSSIAPGCIPASSFTADIKTICPGQSVQFTDVSPGAPTNWNWSFPGGNPATSSLQNPFVTYPNPGNFDVTLTASNANGNTSTTATSFISSRLPTPPPILQSFEGNLLQMDGWEIRNGDQQSTWAITNHASSHGLLSLYIDHYYAQVNGTNDDFYLPSVDLSGLNQARLTFDRAYRRKDNFRRDSLRVEVSSDCGVSWNREWEASLLALASAPGYQNNSPFLPTPSQWKSDTLDLSQYLGQANVRVRFRFTGQGGQDIYLDQINLDASVLAHRGESELLNCSVTSPFRESFFVQYILESPQPVVLTLHDLQGRRHWTKTIEAGAVGQQKVTVSADRIGQLSGGFYVLSIQATKQHKSLKVVKLY